MREISRDAVLERIRAENPWWEPPVSVGSFAELRRRSYFDLLYPLIRSVEVRRAVLLLGPRRVGKTVLLHHVIQQLLTDAVEPSRIGYLSVDHPLYNGLGLEELVELYLEASRPAAAKGTIFLLFDEIQYLRDWEVHLKRAVDDHPEIKFIASGSAAAALRLKSIESGAGRFTDFFLPPLSFFEFLHLQDKQSIVIDPGETAWAQSPDLESMNREFVRYINFGGYPEAVFSPAIQQDPGRFIKADIVDKVLLRDLPSLYGIQDIQELNYLFTTLAYNTAGEVSLQELSKRSGVAKATLKRYIEFLEAAFLVKVVHRIDRDGRRFQRANFFKTYLTNPSIRTALFSQVATDSNEMGALAETAIFSQWFHSDIRLHYARWQRGEIDMVFLGPNYRPSWVTEVKWTDRVATRKKELQHVIDFCKRNHLDEAAITTRSIRETINLDGVEVHLIPTALYCYTIGWNLFRGMEPGALP